MELPWMKLVSVTTDKSQNSTGKNTGLLNYLQTLQTPDFDALAEKGDRQQDSY